MSETASELPGREGGADRAVVSGRLVEERHGLAVDCGPDPAFVDAMRMAWEAQISDALGDEGPPRRADLPGTLAEYLAARSAVERTWHEYSSAQQDAAAQLPTVDRVFHERTDRLMRRYFRDHDGAAFFAARAGRSAAELIDDAVREDEPLRRHITQYAVGRARRRAEASLPMIQTESRSRVLASIEAEALYALYTAARGGEHTALGRVVGQLSSLVTAVRSRPGLWERIDPGDWDSIDATERARRLRDITGDRRAVTPRDA